jgi:2-dehydropantoate 2-reductase
MPQSIAVVGAGAIGQFYAAQFIRAGHEVRLLARRDAATLAVRGMAVHQTPTPNIASTADTTCFTLAPDRFRVAADPVALATPTLPDWVLVALKTTALAEARALIAPLVGPTTRVVAMCNGLGVEDRFADWFGAARVFGLLCFVCVNRDDDGTIRHLGYGAVAAGHYGEDAAERARLADLCRGAGITCMAPASLLEARWRKLVWNVPYNGLAVVHDCTTDAIVGDAARNAEARRLMEEVIATGNADLATHDRPERIEAAWADEQERRTRTMGPYAPSTLLDARAGAALESEVLFAEPLRRARMLGVPTPALERLVAALAR